MSGKTPGRIACETYDRTLFHDGGHDEDIWATRGQRERAAWEAAAAAGAAGAHERTAELASEVNRVTAERDELRTQLSADLIVWNTCSACEAMERAIEQQRALVAEILGALEHSRMYGSRAWIADIPQWRKRAGVEPKPAIVTAGTEHLVAELAEEGR